jgi:tetratricopeptide (TPR) repeat protein
MNFSAAYPRLLRSLLAIACLATAIQASAAPGFIASSLVEGDDQSARISVQLRCNVELVTYQPRAMGDNLRIRLDATQVCTGAAPSIAFNREQHRPIDADTARLLSLEYDGDAPEGQILRFNFSEEVRFEAIESGGNDTVVVQVRFKQEGRTASRENNTSTSHLVQRGNGAPPRYVINLESSVRPPATADMPDIALEGETELFVTEAAIDGKTWYRTRIGYYASAEEASRALRSLRNKFPSAWIDTVDASGADMAVDVVPSTETDAEDSPVIGATASPEDAKVATLMDEARRTMIGGELSRAIQLYTKVLQMPPNPYQQDAQEYLALARERNGQIAHAKAEYQRYLSVYPDGDGVARVEQRLAALVATANPSERSATTSAGAAARQSRSDQSPWTVRTFASQFYRRDVNQLNDEEEITSQSSIYTDVSLDARRRGERFDFSARLTGGHRYDLLDEDERPSTRSDRDLRMSYAYVDLADSNTGLRGRLGRQTRNSGGVLGRFDGLNLTYGLTQRLELEAVYGRPVFSTADSVDDSRTFYGLSAKYGPIGENLDVRVFALQQDIEGLTDRQSVGGEVRYFGDAASVWGMLDYDLEFSELGSLFVQGSVRLPSNFTVTGLIDRRQSPYLSLSNAMIGQPVEDFAALTTMYTAEEIYQLALDRSAATTTFTLGLSKPLTPKLQLGINGTQSTIEATPESGGVPGNPKSTYSYLSLDLVASSLFSERDVTIFGVRYAESTTSNIYTFNIDSRFSIGRSWRISPRIRVDYREISSDASEQWTYTPSLRLEYRWGRKVRLELTAGQQYSARESDSLDQDRESYYISAGYQLFF